MSLGNECQIFDYTNELKILRIENCKYFQNENHENQNSRRPRPIALQAQEAEIPVIPVPKSKYAME